MMYKLDCAIYLLDALVPLQKRFFFLVLGTCSELVTITVFTLSVDKFFCP